MVKDTTCNSNIEPLTFHFALIGLCYIFAIGISKIMALLPGFLGSSMSGLMFMNGMYAAYIVKFLMKKLKIDFLIEDNGCTVKLLVLPVNANTNKAFLNKISQKLGKLAFSAAYHRGHNHCFGGAASDKG